MSIGLENTVEGLSPELDEELYARYTEIESAKDLEKMRGTPIPALFNIFYKFIQNPSTVSVDTFKRMIDTDDTVGSGVDFLNTLLVARLGTYQHENDEITEWVNKALTMMDGGFAQVVKELLSATWAGFAVQEQQWANIPHGFIIERQISLPPATVLFEVDRVGKLTPDGILQYQRNYNPALLGSGGLFGTGFVGGGLGFNGKPDPYAKLGDLAYPIRVANTFNYLSIRIPVQKCVHYAFDCGGKFGNVYGRSLLRRAYNFWVSKWAFMQMLSIALDRKGTPLQIVFTDPNTTVLDQKQYQGQNLKGQFGKGIRSDVAAANAFKEIHNDSVIFLPGMKGKQFDVDTVQVTSNAEAFIAAINLCDRGILKALMVPSLIFTNGDGAGSFALGQEHAKTFDKILDGILQSFKQTLLHQVVKRLLQYNFPREVWEKQGLGDFSKRDLGQEDLDKVIANFSGLQSMGAIDMSDLQDLNKVREVAGFQPRNTVPDSAQIMQDDTEEAPEDKKEPVEKE